MSAEGNSRPLHVVAMPCGTIGWRLSGDGEWAIKGEVRRPYVRREDIWGRAGLSTIVGTVWVAWTRRPTDEKPDAGEGEA